MSESIPYWYTPIFPIVNHILPTGDSEKRLDYRDRRRLKRLHERRQRKHKKFQRSLR